MQWNLDFMAKSDEGLAYADLAQRVDEAVEFMLACGMDEGAAVIEWPERLGEALPQDRLDIEIALDGAGRTARIVAHGAWEGRELGF